MSARFEVTKQSLVAQRTLSELAHATSDESLRVLLLNSVRCLKTYLPRVGSARAEPFRVQSSRLEQRVLHTFQLHVKA